MTRPQVDFEQLLKDEGVPMTSADVVKLLEEDILAANSIISNDSTTSPFWRLFSTCVVTPTLWLIKVLLAKHVLPSMFAATATKYYLELKAWDVGLERKDAVKTQGEVSFTKVDIDADIIIKAGTEIQTNGSLGDVFSIFVLADFLIPAGTLITKVPCQAPVATAAYNLGAGYFHILSEEVPGIDSVRNADDWITRIGADKESDDQLALRIRDQFSGVGNYHIDAVYRAAIASFAGIRSDLLFFEHEAPRGPGTANCHVMLEQGETPQSLVDDINDYINAQGHHGHGDDMRAVAITDLPTDLSLDYWHINNLSSDEIDVLESNIEARVRAAMRESASFAHLTRTLPQSVFSFSILSSELHSDLPSLASVRWNLSDLISGLELPRINTLNITNRGAI